jgi:hypothetical protein
MATRRDTAVVVVTERNGPKVPVASLSKTWLYAGNSEYPALLAVANGSENASGADNQQGSRSPVGGLTPQRLYAGPRGHPRGRYSPGCMATCRGWQK